MAQKAQIRIAILRIPGVQKKSRVGDQYIAPVTDDVNRRMVLLRHIVRLDDMMAVVVVQFRNRPLKPGTAKNVLVGELGTGIRLMQVVGRKVIDLLQERPKEGIAGPGI